MNQEDSVTFTARCGSPDGKTRTSSGTGATLSSGSGTNGYTLVATGNAITGSFSESETGTDRYRLVESFDDVANDASGNTPGNVTFHGEGLPFRDPNLSYVIGIIVVVATDNANSCPASSGETRSEEPTLVGAIPTNSQYQKIRYTQCRRLGRTTVRSYERR